MHIKAADFLMADFGNWCRAGESGLRHKSQMLSLMRQMGVRVDESRCVMSDDRALEVDRYLCVIRGVDEQIVDAVLLYYVCRRTYSGVGLALGVSYSEARVLVRSGLAALAACFRLSKEAA